MQLWLTAAVEEPKLLTIANEREPLRLLVTLMFSLTVFWDFLRSFPRVWSTISSVNRHLGIALSVSAPHWESSRSFYRSHTRGVCHRLTKCPSGRASYHISPFWCHPPGPWRHHQLSQSRAWMWLCLPRSENQQLFQVAVNQPVFCAKEMKILLLWNETLYPRWR